VKLILRWIQRDFGYLKSTIVPYTWTIWNHWNGSWYHLIFGNLVIVLWILLTNVLRTLVKDSKIKVIYKIHVDKVTSGVKED